MDEEIAIIDELTRREKIVNFLIKNKKKNIFNFSISFSYAFFNILFFRS